MLGFRRRVWAIKLIEACCGAAFGVLLAYLITFVLDRFWDTPTGVRVAIFIAAMIGCAGAARAASVDLAATQARTSWPAS